MLHYYLNCMVIPFYQQLVKFQKTLHFHVFVDACSFARHIISWWMNELLWGGGPFCCVLQKKIWRAHFLVWPDQWPVLGNQFSPAAQPTCSCKQETRLSFPCARAPTHRNAPARSGGIFTCAHVDTVIISTAGARDGSRQKTIIFVSLVCGVCGDCLCCYRSW